MSNQPTHAAVDEEGAEYEDPGILADDSNDEEDVSGNDTSSLEHNHDKLAFHDSDFEADVEAGSGNSEDEAAASLDDEQQAAPGDIDSDIDAGLNDDSQPSSSGADEGERSSDEGQDDTSSASNDDDDPTAADPSSSRQQQAASFLEGGKSASFSKAFAKIMAKPTKAAKAAAADVILSESASMAKRKAEEAADEAAARQAKKQRLELKRRGHFKIPKKGEDPALDVREKQLQKLATRGVVLLFNAVNKAQKQKREAEAAGLKGVKALKAKPGLSSKAGFFAELKAGAKQAVAGLEDGKLVPGAPAVGESSIGQQQGSARSTQVRRNVQGSSAEPPSAGGAGWDVLGEGFPGLTGGVKMKDWDKAAVSDEELNGQTLAGSEDDDDDGGDGW